MNFRPLSALVPVLAASCMLGPDFKLPGLGGRDRWKSTTHVSENELPAEWWTLFGDPGLDRLVRRSLAANNDIATAKARFDTAQALVGVDRARLFPELGLSGSAGIARSSGFDIIIPGLDLERRTYRGGFNLVFDPDLWGRNRRALEASSAQAASSAAMLDMQRLGIAAETARQYFVLRGLDQQHAILVDTLKAREEALAIQTSKTRGGLTDALAPSSARTEVELARSDLAVVERQRGAAEHALAVLCGSRPSDFAVPAETRSRALPVIRPDLPAAVLARRPDVRAAAFTLRSANARIGVAEAAFYPNFSITGGAGLESLSTRDFLNWESRVLNLAAGAAMPLVDGGANRARLAAARSTYDGALASYRQSMIVALREVEDSITDLQGLAKSRAALDSALTSANDTRRITQDRYSKGISNYLDVVTADRTVLQVRLAIATTDAQQRISLAALAKALGGGWSGK